MADSATVARYRKKPVEIDAVQFSARGQAETIADWCGGEVIWTVIDDEQVADSILIKTLEGVMRCDLGSWVIKGLEGEFYPCADSVFKSSYDPV